MFFKFTNSLKGFHTSGGIQESEIEVDSFELLKEVDFFKPVKLPYTDVKEGKPYAPYILPCTLKNLHKAPKKTKTCDRHVTDAMVADYLIFDIELPKKKVNNRKKYKEDIDLTGVPKAPELPSSDFLDAWMEAALSDKDLPVLERFCLPAVQDDLDDDEEEQVGPVLPEKKRITAEQISRSLKKLKLGGVFWQTISHHVLDHRWRLMILPSSPIPRKDFDPIWEALAKTIQAQLQNEGCRQRKLIDWKAKQIVQPALLPCYIEGNPVPEVHSVKGRAFPVSEDLKEEAKKILESPYVGKKAYGTKLGRPLKDPDAYTPNPKSAYVPGFLEDYSKGEARRVGITESLDVLAALQTGGIQVGEGGRYFTVKNTLYSMYRTGYFLSDMETTISEIIEKSPIRDSSELAMMAADVLSYFSKISQKTEHRITEMVCAIHADDSSPKKISFDKHMQKIQRYCRWLARADHLFSVSGGKLSHTAIASVLGVHVNKVYAWRQGLIKANMLQRTGTEMNTLYFLPENLKFSSIQPSPQLTDKE